MQDSFYDPNNVDLLSSFNSSSTLILETSHSNDSMGIALARPIQPIQNDPLYDSFDKIDPI